MYSHLSTDRNQIEEMNHSEAVILLEIALLLSCVNSNYLVILKVQDRMWFHKEKIFKGTNWMCLETMCYLNYQYLDITTFTQEN